jgi:hypothetical protein
MSLAVKQQVTNLLNQNGESVLGIVQTQKKYGTVSTFGF